MKADVAIVIVSYNSADNIAACLESVFSQRKKVTQQIILVDNDPEDGTADIVREKFPQVEILSPGKNLGFAAGVNLGARHADAEYILLLNPDTEVLDHAVDVVVEFARANPHYGFYGGRTLKPDGGLEPSSCWGEPTLWSMALFAFGITTLAPRNRFLDPESLGSWPRDTVREVGVITGCFLLASKEAWNKLGGFDERFFMYGEDVDLSMRARKAGYCPVICPDAKIMHEVGQSSRSPVHKTLLLYRGKASLVRNQWTGSARLWGLFLLATGTAVRAGLSKIGFGSTRPGSAARWQTLWQERRNWLPGYGDGQRTEVGS